jgi:Flp pilus assembly protein TadD
LRAKPKDKEIAEAVRAVEYKLKHRTAIEAQMAKQRVEQDMALRSRMAKEAFASQNYEEAVVQLNYLAQATPEDAKIQFALGQSLRALRSYDWAAYRLKMAIYLDPENDLYRKTLVDLDNEIQQTSSQTIGETMDKMLIQMSRSDMAHIGLVNEY